MTRTARLKAYAKLNLGLKVLYRRSDGYHELRTVFQTISLADRLAISFERNRSLRIELDEVPEIPDNLALKAATLLSEALNIRGHIRIQLHKRIPAGAGLGGGSSDAAAVLLALPVLSGRRVDTGELSQLGAALGSDVPFFLYGGAALGIGRGEELYPLPDHPAADGVVVVPNIHSSTAEAYRVLSGNLTSIGLQNKLAGFQQEIWQVIGSAQAAHGGATARVATAAGQGNDFEEVVFARFPELRRIKTRLIRSGAGPVGMTGSGSAIFGIFADPERSAVLLNRTEQLFPEAKVFKISFLSRAQYRSGWLRALQDHTQGNQWPPRSRYAR